MNIQHTRAHHGQKVKIEIFICMLYNFLTIVKLLALALTNLVLDLANLVTNLAKQSQPSHQPDQT